MKEINIKDDVNPKETNNDKRVSSFPTDFNIKDYIGVDFLTDEEKEFSALADVFFGLFQYTLSPDMFNLSYRDINALLKKSIDTKTDYIQEHIQTHEPEDFFELTVEEVFQGNHFEKNGTIKNFLYDFYTKKELFLLGPDYIYGILNHICKRIFHSMQSNTMTEERIVEFLSQDLEIIHLWDMELDSLIDFTNGDLWKPSQIESLRNIQEKVYHATVVKRDTGSQNLVDIDQVVNETTVILQELEDMQYIFRNPYEINNMIAPLEEKISTYLDYLSDRIESLPLENSVNSFEKFDSSHLEKASPLTIEALVKENVDHEL